MNYIINHKRFKKKYSTDELDKYKHSKRRISKFPQAIKAYYDFFNVYAKQNYKLTATKCLCNYTVDELVSRSDRHCVEFPIVICKKCGLIRAKNYFTNENVKDFYQNYYRPGANSLNINYGNNDPEIFFNMQAQKSKHRFDLINKYKIKNIDNKKILDLGGGVGGVLNHFNSNDLYLADYFGPYLNYAKSKGIKTIVGGLNEINFKPDVIILSHIIEHWSNFKEEIKKLIQIQKVGETINYIEFPGVDSLKLGRREGDFIGDVHVPHVYYFTSYVFENIMNRYGFKKIYIDSEIRSIFVYTGEKSNLTNNYPKVRQDLILAEKIRKIHCIKNFIKLFVHNNLLSIIRQIRNKKIKY